MRTNNYVCKDCQNQSHNEWLNDNMDLHKKYNKKCYKNRYVKAEKKPLVCRKCKCDLNEKTWSDGLKNGRNKICNPCFNAYQRQFHASKKISDEPKS